MDTPSTPRPVVIYDGECRFCRWSVRRIQRLDRKGRFEIVPRQLPGIEDRFPILADSDFNTGLRFIDTDGRVAVGADGVYEIYRRLPPYHVVAWVYRLPLLKQVCRAAYAFVARHRHRLGKVDPDLACDTGACEVSYGERQVRATATKS